MGRRARNKQPPPEPLEPFLTSKKLGKRKAHSDKGNSRLTKKIKDVNGTMDTMAAQSRKLDALAVAETDSEEEDDEPIEMDNMGARSRQLDVLAIAETDSEEEEDDEPVTMANMAARSHQLGALAVSETDSEEEEDDDEPVTMANMAARSRQLDALALADAEMDAELLHTVVENDDDDDEMATDGEEDANGDIDAEPFHLPTPAERDEEKAKGGPDVQAVQRRMQHCIRVLAKFSQRAEKGR
jgi:ribosomal RNA methyltransferase Nop2